MFHPRGSSAPQKTQKKPSSHTMPSSRQKRQRAAPVSALPWPVEREQPLDVRAVSTNA